ncbi:MAG: hypothetical protein GX439_06045 [Bacteroidales bacterium]|nr:hypothetical protein [Bacteroidales bacterium]
MKRNGSSTSISNGTFNGLIVNTPASTNVYMLGPSTPMCDVMFSYPQVKGLFGSVFEPHDQKTFKLLLPEAAHANSKPA